MWKRIGRWKDAWRKNLRPQDRPWSIKSPAHEKAEALQHDDTYYFVAAIVAAIHHYRHHSKKREEKRKT